MNAGAMLVLACAMHACRRSIHARLAGHPALQECEAGAGGGCFHAPGASTPVS